jgi:hypothetical protein
LTALHEILAPGAKIWARPTWGPIDPKERVCGFGKEQVARRLESEGQYDQDMILNIGVGTPRRDLPKALTGRLLDVATFVPKVMRSQDIIGPELYRRWIEERGRSEAWPWGLPVVRAWQISLQPLADEVLPGLRQARFIYQHPEQMTTRLSAEEIAQISDLQVEPVEFEVSIADESGLAAQTQATDRVRHWATQLAATVAQRCQGSRAGYVILRPDFETNETDLYLLFNKLILDQGERCRLCGGLLDFSEPPNRLAQPSADRIDSSVKVYDRTNLQITHLACNLGKNECPNVEALEFFRSWCGDGIADDLC